jgi:hypothetical protein
MTRDCVRIPEIISQSRFSLLKFCLGHVPKNPFQDLARRILGNSINELDTACQLLVLSQPLPTPCLYRFLIQRLALRYRPLHHISSWVLDFRLGSMLHRNHCRIHNVRM